MRFHRRPSHLRRLLRRGFTLMELLIVLSILGILTTIVLVAINPSRQLAIVRNVNRHHDIQQVLNAVQHYVVDHGTLPTGIDTTLRMLGTDPSACNVSCPFDVPDTTAAGCLDLRTDLTTTYLTEMPHDPLWGSGGKTYYAIKKISPNRIHVRTCSAEQEERMSVEQ